MREGFTGGGTRDGGGGGFFGPLGDFVTRIFSVMSGAGTTESAMVYVLVLESIIPLVWEMAEDEVEYELAELVNGDVMNEVRAS